MCDPTKHLRGPDTERMTHRAFTVDDAEAAYRLNSDPKSFDIPATSHLPQYSALASSLPSTPTLRPLGTDVGRAFYVRQDPSLDFAA